MCQDLIVKGFEYFRILSMPDFCICKSCTWLWICLNMAEYALWQGSEYAWSTFHRVLNKLQVLNMPSFMRGLLRY